MKKQIDEALLPVWHYFDQIVVEGLSADLLVRRAQVDSDPFWIHQRVEGQVDLLLHLRQIGAVDVLDFREKPHAFCADHYLEHAMELGMASAMDDELEQTIIDRLAKDGTLETTEVRGQRIGFFKHPYFVTGLVVSAPTDRPLPPVEEVARRQYQAQCLALVSDVGQARNLSRPVATVGHWLMSADGPNEPGEGDVALALELPVMKGISAEVLLKLMREHRDEVEAFRHALTQAIREEAERGESDPREAADRVRRDFVDPALADIGRRLDAAQRTLGRKVAQNAAIGSVAISIGWLTGMPMVVGGIAALGASLQHWNRFADEQRDIEHADLYFLWRLTQRGHAH